MEYVSPLLLDDNLAYRSFADLSLCRCVEQEHDRVKGNHFLSNFLHCQKRRCPRLTPNMAVDNGPVNLAGNDRS